MKNFIFIFFLIFLVGCQSPKISGFVGTSSAIFIKQKPQNPQIYVNFTNTSSIDCNLTQALINNLKVKNFKIVSDEKLANVIIKGNLNYFKKDEIKEPNVYFNFGFMQGFSSSFGFGVGQRIDDTKNSYIYLAQTSILISIKNGENFDNYETNLNYQSDKTNSKTKQAIDNFNEKISNMIVNLLEN